MRSKLFVPGSRPELFPKALATAADALSFDLEDAVAEAQKDVARRHVAAALVSPGLVSSDKIVIVRVNRVGSPHFGADLAAAVSPRTDLINLPKVESPAEVHTAVAAVVRIEETRGISRPIGLLVNIESPRGLRFASEIAAADPRVAGLQLGLVDLFDPSGIERANAAAVMHVQLAVRLAAAEAGLWAFDAAFADIKDADGCRAEALGARRLGYSGKTCIHPSQIAIVNEVFQPTADEIAFARRVVATAEKSCDGAFVVDGRMIDAPSLRRARMIVSHAGSEKT